MKTAIIAGASGLIGSHLVKALLADSTYESVVTVVRSPLALVDAKLTQRKADFARLDDGLSSLDAKEADLYCTLGTTIKKAGSQEAFRAVDYEAVMAFAKWGKAKGASRFFLVTALGADKDSSIFYNRVKGEVERDLALIGFTQTEIFRPSLLLGDRAEKRPGEVVGAWLAKPLGPLMLGPLKKWRPVEAKTVADAMLASAKTTRPGLFIRESDAISRLAGRN